MAINEQLSQFASFVEVNDVSRNIGIATTATPYVGIGTTNPIAKFEVVGQTELDDVNISGIATVGSLSIDSTQVISSGRELQNIASLDATTTATIESAIANAPNTFSDLIVTGIATFNSSIGVVGVVTTKELDVVGIATIETLNVQTKLDVYDSQAVFHNDVYVAGNLSIGGTTVSITAQDLRVSDRDIVLGVTTDAFGEDISNDTTANHGGIAIASTEGNPLVNLELTGFTTLPNTYKQLMWVRGDSYGFGTTDAWMFNYAVGIGSTLVPNGVRLAVSEIQFTDNAINTPNINIAKDLRVSGVGTFSTLDSTWIQVGSGITFTTGIGTNLFVSGVGTITQLVSTSANITGVGTIANLSSGIATVTKVHVGIATTYSEDLVVSGNARVTGILTIGTGSITLNGNDDSIFVGSGVTILGQTGIVSAYKFYGDGSSLIGTISGIGIRSEGADIGYGATILDFRGPGVSTVTNITAGIATIFFEGGGSGSIGIGTSFPSFDNANGDLFYNANYGRLFVYYDESVIGVGTDAFWVDAAPFNVGILTGISFSQLRVGAATTFTETLVVQGDARVTGILTIGTETLTIHTSGDIYTTGIITAFDFDSLSDINYKDNVETVNNALLKVEQMRGVKFDWKESGRPSYGVIAQELQEVLPELVHGEDPKTVNYNGIIGVLIEAIKELKQEIEDLKK